ncbi:MAG: DUF4147 domain-containing protein [Candidatus Paceibacterota bacterium]
MKINNFEKLAITDLRKRALEIAEVGLEVIDTKRVIRSLVKLSGDKLTVLDKEISLERFNNIFIIGVGKASFLAGQELEVILKDKLKGGVIIDIKDGGLEKLKVFKGTHPLPSEENKRASKYIVDFLKDTKATDLVIVIISGGGSALLHGSDELSPENEAKILKELFRVGATIEEINTIRKHTSFTRGGHLARYIYPAKAVSLIFSDVPGDDMQFISSGPTIKDKTTIEAAEAVLDRYNILEKVGLKRINLLETPKDDKYFDRVDNILVLSNKHALEAMADQARRLGFAPIIKTNTLRGEASKVGVDIAKDLKKVEKGTALIYGGETTVTLKGDGKGGRNQELALAALTEISDSDLILTLASDGRDNTDHAGAICDINTKQKIRNLKISVTKYLEDNDTYRFFEKVGDYIDTGDTGSNVSDLIIAIKG